MAIELFRHSGRLINPHADSKRNMLVYAGKHERVMVFKFMDKDNQNPLQFHLRFHSWDRHGSEAKGTPVSILANCRETMVMDPQPCDRPIDPDLGPVEKELYDHNGLLVGCSLV